jgi:cellulose synthase/poly-beta-1,6-N-acetylglucosamine synthase-like glycosyltransferase
VNGYLLIALLLAGIALAWAVLLTLQVHEHKRFVSASLRKPASRWQEPPVVLVCVPCKGLDLDLADNLRCVLKQDYPNYRVRFVVDAADDPARAVIDQLIRETAVPCELLVAGTCTDSGQKVHNLCYATAELPEEIAVLVFYDSDARPAPDSVTRLVNCVCRDGLQVATGYRWFVPRCLTLANLTLASINAAVAGLFKHHGWNLIWGGSWAITRELFENTAVAHAWRGTLSDDLVASRVLRLAGATVVFEPGCMATSPIDVTWKEAATFLRRQFLICRCYAPMWWWATAPLTVLQPLVLFGGVAWAGLLACAGNASWFWPLLPSGMLYALTVLRGHWRQAVWRPYVQGAPTVLRATARFDRWAAPWSCLFAAGTMLTSAVGRSIMWRDIHYHIGPAGRITLLGRMPGKQQRREMLATNLQRRDHERAARLAAGALG